jgi:hypothetical protein
VCVGIALVLAVPASGAAAATLEPTPLPALPGAEAEPNDVPATASPIQSGERVRAGLTGAGDVDYFRFTALTGERVFANVVTAGAEGTGDSTLSLIASDEVTELESDDNDGSQGDLASSIAGFTIPADGTYYLRVDAGGSVSPYDLYLQLRPAALPGGEIEATNNYPLANPLTGGEVTGVHSAKDEDWFSFFLNAGDTVFLSLHLAGADVSSAQLAFGVTGDSGNPLRIPARSGAPDPLSPSEALTVTAAKSGTYYATVGSIDGSPGDPEFEYDLSATVLPAALPACRRYSAASQLLRDDGQPVSFPIAVDDVAQITRAAVHLELEETVMADLDVSLRSPSGTEVPLFTDIGSTAPGGQTQMDAVLDDYAAVPPLYQALRPLDLQLEGGSRLASFAGQQTQGVWSVTVRDDTANASFGTVGAVDLILCGPQTAAPRAPLVAPPAPQAKPAPPKLSGLTFAPSRFRAAKSGPMVQAKRAASGGALVTYQDSERAQTNFILFEAEPGRKVGAKCAHPTKANATKKTCTRLVKVISFVRSDRAGRNQFGFLGRVGARKLPPGEYQLQGRAYAPSGLTSDPVVANFTVLPQARAK